ncbi:MAG: hypothetical protein Q8S00_04210 [Deltaproteobacteria bacterium]|nr:hypothetical protein [Deltaproteobacteria bacterium]MDZ4344009.1 hypothetical protein [Candidatus Binatia bacterium]
MKALTILLFLSLFVACGSLRPDRDMRLQISESQAQMRLALIKQDWPAFETALAGFQQRYEDLIGPSENLNRYIELVRQEGKLVFQAEQAQDAKLLDTEFDKLRPEKDALAQLLVIQVRRAQIEADKRADLLRALSGANLSVQRGSPSVPPSFTGPNPHEAIMRCGGRAVDFVTGRCM